MLVDDGARDLEIAALELTGEELGVWREKAERTQLDPVVAGVGDLVQDQSPGRIARVPTGENPPRHRCVGDLNQHCVLLRPAATGRCSASGGRAGHRHGAG